MEMPSTTALVMLRMSSGGEGTSDAKSAKSWFMRCEGTAARRARRRRCRRTYLRRLVCPTTPRTARCERSLSRCRSRFPVSGRPRFGIPLPVPCGGGFIRRGGAAWRTSHPFQLPMPVMRAATRAENCRLGAESASHLVAISKVLTGPSARARPVRGYVRRPDLQTKQAGFRPHYDTNNNSRVGSI
jgi:hypothetical protein